MSVTDKTVTETFDSLTGFDEIAIKARFGQTIMALSESENKQETTFLRALAFVTERRNGSADAQAYSAVMETAIGFLMDGSGAGYFAPDAVELDPSDPETDAGKGDATTS